MINTEEASNAAAPSEELSQVRSLIGNAWFGEAESRLRVLLERDLDEFHRREARYALAIAQRYQKRFGDAIETISRMVAADPEYGRAFQELGYCRYSLRQNDMAIEAFTEAVKWNPALLPSWRALANLLNERESEEGARFALSQAESLEKLPREVLQAKDLFYEGRLLKAEKLCRNFLNTHRRHVEGMRLLAEIGIRLKALDDAEFLLESCLAFEPEHLGARVDYVKILNRKGKFAKAREQAECLLAKDPDNLNYKLSMASALSGLGKIDEAIAVYEACLEGGLEKPQIHVMLGHAQKASGLFREAIESYRNAYRAEPNYGDAYWSLANTKAYRFSDEEVQTLHALAEKSGLASEDRAQVCFAAGKAHEDRKAFASSFAFYEKGNALKRQRSGYDPDKTEAMVDAQMESCAASLFRSRGDLGCSRPDPIFIVGLPRAGSTLLEQILASHSKVDGTMELHEILGLAQRLRGRSAVEASRYPRILWELDESYFRRFGEKFIADTQAYRGNAPYFIDKMPNNFLHVGLIRLILPRAKVIDARRHPMACCFSGYKQLFGEGQDFSYDMEWMGRYYKDYVRLMDHWSAVLPGFVLRVDHESVVEDLETEVRRILDFCGLPFEQGCVDFHETKRNVRTPSSEQVRQPISRTGLDQWRNYESFLEPMKEALGEDVRERYGIR